MKDEHDPGTMDLEEKIAGAGARPKAIGAWIFSGGFSIGVQKHFDVACHLEETNYGVATARKNMPNLPIHVGKENWPLEELKKHEWDFVFGNPACSAWSQAGAATKKGRTWDSSPLVNCTRAHFDLIEVLRPKVWAWESVQRAWTLGESFVRGLATRAVGMGYSTTILLHDAQYLGVPQRRQRFFMLCHCVELPIATPEWATTTIDEALRSINDRGEPLERNIGKVRWLLPHVRQGENLSSAFSRVVPEAEVKIGDRGQVVGRPPFTIKRARSGQPAPVVMHELVHPTEDRGLSIRELATLSGYPSMYEFVGATDAGQVGRGVCPPVGAYLAEQVARAVRADVAVAEPRMTLVDYTRPPGRIEELDLTTTAQETSASTTAPEAATNGADRCREVEIKKTAVGAGMVEPAAGQGSGAYIKSLLLGGAHTTEQILALVHQHFPKSKASKSDVVWNRGRLKKEGVAVPAGPGLSAQAPSDTRVPSLPVETHAPQPQAKRQGVDPDREFDKTSLRANSHGQWVHRDYLAHAFRWGFAGRYVTNETEVLDVGCGPDCAMVGVLTMPRNQVPRRYVGVDVNREPRRHPTRQWATFRWEFNFLERYAELGQFDLVINFEVIEHMRKSDGERLLAGLAACLKPDGALLLSTPVFNGKAAANHIHEWEVGELADAVRGAGLDVARRHGTFASQNDLKKVASPAELDVVARLSAYYSGEVMSCFLAPLYPDASRNNVWVLRRRK